MINQPRILFEFDSGGVRQDQDEQGSRIMNGEGAAVVKSGPRRLVGLGIGCPEEMELTERRAV